MYNYYIDQKIQKEKEAKIKEQEKLDANNAKRKSKI
jgi:hypothetical protein